MIQMDSWADTYGDEAQPRMGFFTDTSVCIGCKACEVACKEWNVIPEDGLVWTGESYDNTSTLGANSWRHVAFIEQRKPLRIGAAGTDSPTAGDRDEFGGPDVEQLAQDGGDVLRWLMSSDVCKHCTHAGCLDVCPTGSLFRSEFGTVVVQEDICNGCGYCVPACPFGVLDKRHLPRKESQAAGGTSRFPQNPSTGPLSRTGRFTAGTKEDGRVWKCTLCYDRLKGGHEPACAKACPTDSIQFGPVDELRERADLRLEKLEAEGWNGPRLYGRDPDDGVGGFGAFFLLLDEPEVYGLPPDPVVPTKNLPQMWRNTAVAAAATVVGAALAFIGGRG